LLLLLHQRGGPLADLLFQPLVNPLHEVIRFDAVTDVIKDQETSGSAFEDHGI